MHSPIIIVDSDPSARRLLVEELRGGRAVAAAVASVPEALDPIFHLDGVCTLVVGHWSDVGPFAERLLGDLACLLPQLRVYVATLAAGTPAYVTSGSHEEIVSALAGEAARRESIPA